MKSALVLGAGGPAAAAFEIGMVAGLADGGVDVRAADLFVGTSAGARVAVQLAGNAELGELYRRQLAPRVSAHGNGATAWRDKIVAAKQAGGTPREVMRRVGALALGPSSNSIDARRADLAAQLSDREWPAKCVLVVAVEAESGERRAFERTSAVALTDAIAASGSLPGLWPAIEIAGKHYMDGGMYSTDNADLAAGCDHVLVIALRAGNPRLPLVGLEDTTRDLGHVKIIQPDDACQAALTAVGGNVLDPAVGPTMAKTAREQGRQLARRIAMFWRGERAA